MTSPAGDDLGLEGITTTPTDLTVDVDLPRDRWYEALQWCGASHRSLPWHVGALLVYGDRRGWTTRRERYEIAERLTGFGQQTLKNQASVFRGVPPHVRRQDLSWSHHRAVVKLAEDDQVRLLAEASRRKWTAERLAEEVVRPGGPQPTSGSQDVPEPEADPEAPMCRCPKCGFEWVA